jgi:hypothetical protein
MSNLSAEQKAALNKLGDHFPGLGRTDGIVPAQLGSFLGALGPVTSPDAVDLPTALVLLNEIKTKINAACAASAVIAAS